MCFYIYSPQHNIEIEYLSEYISLDENGASAVTTNLLIKNASPDPLNNPIETLRIIYPNKFYDVTKNDKIIVDTSKVIYEDSSLSFNDETSSEDSGFISHNNNLSYIIPDWASPRTLEMPDPDNPLMTLKFEGIVAKPGTLRIEQFTSTQFQLLHTICFCVFTYELAHPIDNLSRWISLNFKGKNAAHNIHLANHRFQRKIFNMLHYDYQIFGPYDVRKRFILYLLSNKRRYEVNQHKEESRAILASVNGLVDYFAKDGLIGDDSTISTLIKNLFIHVNPGKLERLTDFIKEGEIKISGFPPNLIFKKNKTISLYQWKFLNKEKSFFKFALIFQAKPMNLLYPKIPLIALSVASIGLLTALYNLFLR